MHYTEKQCSKALTVMLRGIRGIVRPENKNSLQELSAPTKNDATIVLADGLDSYVLNP